MSTITTMQLAGDQLAPVLARLARLPELRAGHDAGRRGESVPIEYRRTAGKVRGSFGFPQVAAEMLNAEHELLLATAEPQRGIGRFESVRRARQARAALIEREPRVAAFMLGWELGKARIPLPVEPARYEVDGVWIERRNDGTFATAQRREGPYSVCPVSDASDTEEGAIRAHRFYFGN